MIENLQCWATGKRAARVKGLGDLPHGHMIDWEPGSSCCYVLIIGCIKMSTTLHGKPICNHEPMLVISPWLSPRNQFNLLLRLVNDISTHAVSHLIAPSLLVSGLETATLASSLESAARLRIQPTHKLWAADSRDYMLLKRHCERLCSWSKNTVAVNWEFGEANIGYVVDILVRCRPVIGPPLQCEKAYYINSLQR